MGYRRDVPDAGDNQTGPLKGTDGRLPAGAGAFDENIDVSHSGFSGSPAGLFRSPLRCEGRAFA